MFSPSPLRSHFYPLTPTSHCIMHFCWMETKRNRKTAARDTKKELWHTQSIGKCCLAILCAQLPAKGPALSLCQEISHSANSQRSKEAATEDGEAEGSRQTQRHALALFSCTTTNSKGVWVRSEEPERCSHF